jgi:16S rRNA (uracil1498-N3)-methyltransferase
MQSRVFADRLFYIPAIEKKLELPKDESKHCVCVLRLSQGNEITLTDGKGFFYLAEIASIAGRRCTVTIKETIFQEPLWEGYLHMALAPAKSTERNEWFVEKAVEIGINEFTFLNCRFSERRVIKAERMTKIMVSAVKQSLKARLPKLNEMTDFNLFISQEFKGQKFITHCREGEKLLLKDVIRKGENALVLVGPEGDFSENEVKRAEDNGFISVSLGKSRLRTETAGLAACHIFNLINQ